MMNRLVVMITEEINIHSPLLPGISLIVVVVVVAVVVVLFFFFF